ncbi:tRNA-2-methylthio-N(6)-dimethylallyladenosine synthase MiaB [Oceanibaculum pacificum]|uniref:tRNA-2-methylthio-N(6)-dimethylallyladenosine synthase n=2 Tax=Oceanibaculum pacificum TaxID=580166 RepID=A0A154VSA0_9PROT|nr:tRNA-2-methylthio-N(6)-dimethylallyladenosine synthase MiaB [Oceanibaculum pacificum]
MNVYDSARMADVLAPLGYEPADAPDGADMVIVNTCHIRENASEKTFHELGRLRQMKQRKAAEGGQMVLAVAGCVAQAEGAEIMARAPFVDMVFGPQAYHRLPEMVARATRSAAGPGERGVLDTDFPVESKFDHLPEEQKLEGASAFLTVQEGCDKFCTFCVVPYTRGAEFSRPAAQIVAEARRLVGSGAKEITLLGQNVNAYHGAGPDGRDWGLGRLIRALAEIDGLARIRYTTSHPRDMDDDLISAHGAVPALMPYLHLPVQSGSDRVLEAMNRKHKAADYRRIVDKLRAARPDLALSSDFIVGFPGESEADFKETLKLVGDVGYAQAFSFKYSSRPGTPAALLEMQIEEQAKSDRLYALQALLTEQQTAFNASMAGRTLPVLVEKTGKLPGQLIGKSPYLQSVVIRGNPRLIGQIVPVAIDAGYANSLSGSVEPVAEMEGAA